MKYLHMTGLVLLIAGFAFGAIAIQGTNLNEYVMNGASMAGFILCIAAGIAAAVRSEHS